MRSDYLKWKSCLYLILCLHFIRFIPVFHCMSCNKVATLPPEFDILLPNHNKLKRAHLSNYFFIQDNNDKNEQSLHIPIQKKSVIKLQITPYHTQIRINIVTPTRKDTYTKWCTC